MQYRVCFMHNSYDTLPYIEFVYIIYIFIHKYLCVYACMNLLFIYLLFYETEYYDPMVDIFRNEGFVQPASPKTNIHQLFGSQSIKTRIL